MNKKLKFIIAGFAVVAGLASAVSCQDLSKDVDSLSKEVASLKTLVNDLQTKINAGAVITNVASTSTGIEITLSDGKKYTVSNGKDGANGTNGTNGTNGKDGTPGSVITIGDNGNWFIDGVDTGKPAVGQAGAAGKDGDSIYWDLSADGKKFVEYKNGVATGKEVAIPAAQGAVTAKWDAEKGILTIYGAEGSEEGLPIVLTNNAAAAAAVSLVESYEGATVPAWRYTQGYRVKNWYWGIGPTFSNVIEKANVFEEGIKNAYTFEEDKQHPVGGSLLVRVSPANYEPKAEDFQFVNSLGDVFDQIKVVNVEPYAGLLVKSTTETGLWVVDVVLEEYKEEDFNAMAYLDGDPTLGWRVSYAVKVGDAVSSYDLDFSYVDFVPSNVLDFYVGPNLNDAEWIGNLNNRYQNNYAAGANPSLKQPGETKYEELTWTASTASIPTPAVEPVKTGTKKNVQVDAGDDRGALPVYKAVLGEEINIYAGDWFGTAFEYDPNIWGMYVTLDSELNAIESAPSEWNAWKSYEDGIEGLNEVKVGPRATITINKPSADGDIIGFRVYAANLDGTLVDPDGRAFYVQVGKAGTELAGINTVMNTIAQFQAGKTGDVATNYSKITAASWMFNMTDDELVDGSAFTGTFHLINGAGADVIAAADGDANVEDIDLSTIKKANFTTDGTLLYLYEDGKTYKGEFTFFNADGFVIATIPVSFTKTLPTSIAEVPVKTNQLDTEDGKYRCFLIPTTWTAYDKIADAVAAGQKGNMDMLSIFNFPGDDPNGYEITFAAAKKNAAGKLVDVTVKPDTKLSADDLADPTVAPNNWINVVDLDLIDNKTEHKTTVVYNMGQVSSEKITWNADATIKSIADYTLNAGEFETIFFCIYNDDAKYGWPWSWKNDAAYTHASNAASIKKGVNKLSLVYEDFDGQSLPANLILGASKWDSKYKGNMPTGYNNTIKVQKAELVTATGANKGKVEYYDVAVNGANFDFTMKSGATNPTDKVASTLVVTYTDMYGHEMKANLDAEVLHR